MKQILCLPPRDTVAKRAAAEERGVEDASDRGEQEPGYHLIAKRRHAIEKEIGFRVPGTDYYVSKALPLERFGHVLQSFSAGRASQRITVH